MQGNLIPPFIPCWITELPDNIYTPPAGNELLYLFWCFVSYGGVKSDTLIPDCYGKTISIPGSGDGYRFSGIPLITVFQRIRQRFINNKVEFVLAECYGYFVLLQLLNN